MGSLRAFCILLVFACPITQAQTVQLDTPAVLTALTALYRQASPTFLLSDSRAEEYAVTINSDGTVSAVQSSNEQISSRVSVAAGSVAIIHTHPGNVRPQPSAQDIAVARQLGIPNYELSVSQLWAAFPDGSVRHIADVSFKHGSIVLKPMLAPLLGFLAMPYNATERKETAFSRKEIANGISRFDVSLLATNAAV